MNSIREPRDYIWSLPFIGGILTLISFFTPGFYVYRMGIEGYYWMWGLLYESVAGYGSDTHFFPTEEPFKYTIPIFLSSMIPAVLILIGSILLVNSSNAVRKGKKDIKKAENGWFRAAIILIIASIIFIIGIDITWINYVEYQYQQEIGYVPELIDFWDAYDPGFAIIAPFIGAGFSIVGSIASKAIKPREEHIFIREKEVSTNKKVIGEIFHQINFCPECGNKILYTGSKFCSFCGNDLKL